jgi:hypothetical protein
MPPPAGAGGGAASAAASATTESFMLMTGEVAHNHLPAILAAIKKAGLEVSDEEVAAAPATPAADGAPASPRGVLRLLLDGVLAERILMVVAGPDHARGGRPPAAAASEHAGGGGGGGGWGAPPSPSQHQQQQHLGSTQRRFGGTMSAANITGALAERFGAGRPTVDEVEAFSSESGPVVALLISCVDPRVDVCARVAALVGVGEEGGDGLPEAARNPEAFRARFRSAAGPAHILAPTSARAASRGGHLLREYALRQAAAGAGSAMARTLAAPATAAKGFLVDLDVLFDFVFPAGQQHPRSTGRLLLFALHGPLTRDGRLTGGRRNGRPLTESEVTTMVWELERDDVLAVYTAGSVLGDVGAVLTAVAASATGGGQVSYPRMSRAQVEAMLADLPRDSRGRCSFHDIQRRVLGARLQRVADMRQAYPPIAASAADKAAEVLKIAPAPIPYGRGKLADSMAVAAATGRLPGARPSMATARAGTMTAAAAAAALTGGRASVKLVGGLDVRVKTGVVEAFRVGESLLHRNTFMIAGVADAGNSRMAPTLAANTKIIRGDIPGALDRFDKLTPFRHAPAAGTRVPGSITRAQTWKPTVLKEE